MITESVTCDRCGQVLGVVISEDATKEQIRQAKKDALNSHYKECPK